MSRTAIALMLLPAILASVLLATKSDRQEVQVIAANDYLFASEVAPEAQEMAVIDHAADDAETLPDDPKARIVAVGAAILYGLEWSRR